MKNGNEMNLVEFIGFVIAMIALLFLFIKKRFDEYKRQQNPQEYARTERQRRLALKRFFRDNEIPYDDGELDDEEDFDDEYDEEEYQPQPTQKVATHSDKRAAVAPSLPPVPPIPRLEIAEVISPVRSKALHADAYAITDVSKQPPLVARYANAKSMREAMILNAILNKRSEGL